MRALKAQIPFRVGSAAPIITLTFPQKFLLSASSNSETLSKQT
jgi:hypothetical protein